MRTLTACGVFFLLACQSALCATNGLISLSHYDEGVPDYSGLRSQGIEGIIHEATYPSFTRDAKYAYRQNGASKAGLLWGAYHFGNGGDGAKQADHFLETVRVGMEVSPSKNGVLLVLDAEKNTHYPGGTMGVTQAVSFIRRVHERTGIYPGVYSNENWIKELWGNPRIDAASRATLNKCWLWIANYHYRPAYTGPWQMWHLWQYTGDGVCQLPRGLYPTAVANMRKVERTIFNGDRDALRDFWAKNSWKRSDR